MTNYNQNQFSNQQAYQPGYSGTDVQHVRQQNAMSAQPQMGVGNYQQTGHQRFGAQQNTSGQFSGSQAVFQPGYSGTDVQHVRQQNTQSYQPQFSYGSYQQMGQQGYEQSNMGHIAGPQGVFQPGFAGTEAQHVRHQNSQLYQQVGGGHYSQSQQPSYATHQIHQYSGPQSVFQHGFSGTDVQHVRQQNMQSIQPQYGNVSYQQSQPPSYGTHQSNFGQYSGPQSVFQHGFSGTDVQHVRQQNAQSSQSQYGGNGYN
ncbi:hypothetical protein DS745_22280 [Anaerobacillus alkaliphilus]|uniref:Uncharacterized protein n=1 Tax=Anaerobacillus alkaliphilus TaxID=1548597 RepID=A0A4Q0VNN2_9BACI|nr:hypothetical protein [Anaerobacillus alkaliphilus]RXI96442.1 hypothetical protein DS745_22280 [Anaerobacillus alkaliphilus]